MSQTPQEVFAALRKLVVECAGRSMERDGNPYMVADAEGCAASAFDEHEAEVMALLQSIPRTD